MIFAKSADKKAKSKKEKGAIALISVFASIVVIMLCALVLDFGLYYYNGARLQNAVDSAATAVAAQLDATDLDKEAIARIYLNKNGFSSEKYDMSVDIETKGVLQEGSATEADEYVTNGYMKLTVTLDDDAHFATMLGFGKLTMQKSAFVKANANYIAMPRALKYTIFAGSTKGTAVNPALQINGRTGDVTNFLVGKFEQFINGVNENIIQPIIEYFGGEGDYTDLIHITLSEAITDGDVHSNSNGTIGVQALNASRVMDGNLTTIKKKPMTDSNGNPLLDDDGNVRYEPDLDSDGNYQYVSEYANGNNDYNDYGQVTYSLVNDIKFNNSSDDVNTHAYVQNQQYLQKTQQVLSILSEVDMTSLANTEDLRSKFNAAAQIYVDSGACTAEDVDTYKANLSYNTSTKTVTLANQQMIVYDVSRDTANYLLTSAYSQGPKMDIVNSEVQATGTDPVFKPDGVTLKYRGVADKESNIDYSIVISQINSENKSKDITINVTGITANRDYTKTGATVNNTDNSVTTGAKYALASTFKQELGDAGFIATPNMKPYFVREINKSIRNATKSKEELTSSEEAGQKNIKAAVAKLTDDIDELMEATGFTDSKYVQKITTDGKTVQTLKNEAFDILFKYKKDSDSSGLTELTGDSRTTFNGIKLIDRSDDKITLKTPSSIINNTAFGKTDTSTRIEQVKTNSVYVDRDHSNANVTDYQKHYGKEAVDKKRTSLVNQYSPTSVKQNYGDFTTTAPSDTDVFIRSGSTPLAELNAGISYARSLAADASMAGSDATVSKPSIAQPDAVYSVSEPVINDRTVVIDGRSYNVNDITNNAAGATALNIINNIEAAHNWGNADLKRTGNIHYTNATYTHNYNGNASYTGERGLNVRAGEYLLEDGYAKVGKNSNGYKEGCTVNGNSYLLLKGNPLYKSGNNYYTVLDAGQSNGLTVNSNGYVIANGNVWLVKFSLGSNAVMIVNGDLYVNDSINISDGATLIVTGSVTANNKSVNLGTNSKLYIGGTLTYAGGSGNGKLNLSDGCTLVINNSNGTGTTFINYDTTVPSGATLYIKGTTRVWHALNTSAGTIYTENLLGYDGEFFNIDVDGGTFYNNGSITATYLDASDNSIYTGAVTLNERLTATRAYCTGDVNVNDISCYQVYFAANVTTNTISYYGNMIVGGKLTINGNYTIPDSPMKVKDLECNGVLTNAYSKLTITGSLKSNSLVNTGNIVTGGSIYITGDLNNGDESNSSAVIYSEGAIKVDGALTNYAMIAALAYDDTANGVTSFVVGGTTDNKGNAVIYAPNGSYTTYNLTLNRGSNFTTSGSLIIQNLLINRIDLKISGSFSAKRIRNEKVLYCQSSVQLEYIENSSGATFACDGALTITSQVDDISLKNEGLCYINGNLSTVGAVYVDKGALYVNGDLSGANSTSNVNALVMNNHSKVYVQGRVKSEADGKHIYIMSETYDGAYAGAPTNTVLSIYNAHSPLIPSGYEITELCNMQSGSAIYLGTGTVSGSELIDRTINFSGNGMSLQSAGTLYVYGNLTLSNATDVLFTGGGKTYIKGKLNAQNAKLTIIGGAAAGVDTHEFAVWEDAKLRELSISNTNFYALSSLAISSGNIEIKNGSIFFSGENSSIDFSSSGISISASTVYMPKISGTFDYFSCLKSDSDLYGIITESNVKFTKNLTIPEGVTFYIGGNTTFVNDIEVNNYGNLYMMGNVDLKGIKKFNETKQFVLGSGNKTNNKIACLTFGANSDTFIGKAVDKDYAGVSYVNTVCFPATFIGNGTIYLDNNLYAGLSMDFNEDLNSSGEFVANRRAGISIKSGSTYVSGNITTADNTGLLVGNDTTLSCGGDLITGSAIYNYGKLIAFGSHLPSQTASKPTDREDGKNMHGGYSIKNGENEGDTNDLIFIGGTSRASLYGYVVNYGQYYHNADLNVTGFTAYGGMQGNHDCAIVNGKGAKLMVGGNTCLNANAFFNDENAVFNCGGNFDYGICVANCNEFVVDGDIVQNKVTNGNSAKWRNDDSMSFMNGFRKLDGTGGFHSEAVLYCGGKMQLGNTESGGEAGSFVNMGSAYVGDDLLVYCNKGNSYFITAIWNFNGANMVVGGNCFGGAGIVSGNNSVFMCGKGYESKRSTKINVNVYKRGDKAAFTYSDENKYTTAYFYVGGDMLANVLGKTVGSWDNKNIINSSRDLDIYSNSNIYVHGMLYANCKLYMKQNVNMIINGADCSDDSICLKNAVGSMANTPYKLYISKCIDQNICSNLIVNGPMHVRDTAKIRDMTKTYVYGDFSCEDYVEIGKSLSEGDIDETEAKLDKYKADGENDKDYVFSNAGYMYVGGNFTAQKYFKLYASTTMRISGNCVAQFSYITLRHDANLYAGGNIESATSVDVGSYSKVVAGGNLKAKSSTIKIRDNVTCYVGGNMTALRYIELGKFGDYTRHIVNADSKASFPNPNAANTSYKVGYLYHANDTNKYYYWSNLAQDWKEYDYKGVPGGITQGTESPSCNCCDECTDTEGCTCGCSKCIWKSGGSSDSTGAGSDENHENEGAGSDETMISTQAEITYDDSDFAHGSTFYVGKTLASYLGYIKEFAYSKVVVGDYVFTPKYLTLRHNADLWVMPETFSNSTYVIQHYQGTSDGTLWGDIKNELGKIAFNVSQAFTPKTGSIYTLGELTLNKNSSLMGTFDCTVNGKCVLRQDSLIYMGHDFTLTAPSLNLSMDSILGRESVCGFDTYGTSVNGVSYPVVVYADNEINIMTTVEMKLTYLVANRGDVKLYDIYSRGENAENNATQLPNAIASYNGNIDYFAMYGKLGALMYCPNGRLDIDGYYVELWGSGIGNTVKINTYYFAMHRFSNWRTMNLNIAGSGNVFLISEKEYYSEKANDNTDNIFDFNRKGFDITNHDVGGVDLFFDVNN